MSKYFHYLLLLLVLITPTGCATVHNVSNGVSSGLDKDVRTVSDPDKNGWHALENADAWLQEHLW